MKRLLIILYLFAINISIAQSNFSKGFSEGYKKGYCQDKGINCIEPLAPIAPVPNAYENINSYQDGYNRGFTIGSNANKSNSNSTIDRQRYETTEAKYVQDKMYKTNLNDAVAVGNMLYNFKDEIINLGDKNPERQIQLCKAGLSVNPNDAEFLSLIGRAYYRHYNDDEKALYCLEKAYRIEKSNGLANLIKMVKNGTLERVNPIKEEITKETTNNTKFEPVEIVCKIPALFRDAPISSSNSILEIPTGTKVYAIAKENNYWKFNYNGKLGFAAEAFFEKNATKSITSSSFSSTEIKDNLELGYSNYYAKDYPNAIKYFSLAYNQNKDSKILYYRALSKGQIDDTYGALSDYDKLIEIANSGKKVEELATIYNNKAYQLVKLKRYGEALTFVYKALDLDKTLAYIWDTKGEILYNLDYYEQSINAMNEAINIKEDSNSYFFRGLSNIKLNKKEVGCRDLSKAGELGKSEAYTEIKKYCK